MGLKWVKRQLGKILYIEDEADSVKYMLFLLEEKGLGFGHETSSDGAMETIKQFTPDIVISDWSVEGSLPMPELVMAIRKLNPEAKLIFVTGYGKEVIEKALFEIKDYIVYSKPLDFNIVLDDLLASPSSPPNITLESAI